MREVKTVNTICALCPAVLSGENQSKEHIIPNSIGGRRKVRTFICKSCNSKLGETWDAELAKQLNWCALTLGVSRERGEVPRQLVQTVEGARLWLRSDGTMTPEKPSYSEKLVEGKTEINFTARDLHEAKRMIGHVKRNHPGFDELKAHEELVAQQTYLDSPLHMNMGFGGPQAGRSLVKTAFAHASDSGVPHRFCDLALKYLTDDSFPPSYGLAYLSDLVRERPADKVFHCVSLMGDPGTERLFSYIEYFGMFRVLVRLSSKYTGPIVHETYAIDPITGGAVSIDIDWGVGASELEAIFDGRGYSEPIYRAAFDYAMPILLRRNQERHTSRAVGEAFVYAARTLGIDEDEIIAQEKWPSFVGLMMEKLSPFLHHLVARGFPGNSERPAFSEDHFQDLK